MPSPTSSPASPNFDLLIIGAGLSGISALQVARKYLPLGKACIGLVDARPALGGQWNDAYDYVRLHQPYAYYTAYDAKWTRRHPRGYLASRDDVLHYLSDVVKKCSPKMLFGHRYVSHVQTGDDQRLVVKLQKTNGEEKQVETKRLIFANPVPHVKPHVKKFSSKKITSLSTAQLQTYMRQLDVKKNKTRFVIIGSGKSAMDTVKFINDYYCTSTHADNIKVTLISGNGIAFVKRERMYPESKGKCLVAGTTPIGFLVNIATAWNGSNHESQLREFMDSGILISAVPDPTSCVFGVVGGDEMETIRKRIDVTIRGRLSDVVDENDISSSPFAIMENGDKLRLSPASSTSASQEHVVMVNCTETFDSYGPPKPIISDNGCTLTCQLVFLLPGTSCAFLTHAWFLGKIDKLAEKLIPLEIPLDEESKRQLLFKVSIIGMHNFGLLGTILPTDIQKNDASNSMDWYPMYRQVLAYRKFGRAYPEIARKCRKLVGDIRFPPNE